MTRTFIDIGKLYTRANDHPSIETAIETLSDEDLQDLITEADELLEMLQQEHERRHTP